MSMRLGSMFAFIPLMGVPMLSTNIIPVYSQVAVAHPNASLKQINMAVRGIFALNQEQDPKAQLEQVKADAIDAYFSKYDMPLEGTGLKMVREAEKNGLDWRLVAAISVRESTGGKFECKKADFNAFGWGSCKINFKSDEHAIEIVAYNLGGNNPKTAQYYANKNTKQILRAYNPPSVVLRYAEQVMNIMSDIGPKNLGNENEVAINS